MIRILGVLGLLVILYAVLFNTHANAGKLDNLSDVANYQGRYGLITLGVAAWSSSPAASTCPSGRWSGAARSCSAYSW